MSSSVFRKWKKEYIEKPLSDETVYLRLKNSKNNAGDVLLNVVDHKGKIKEAVMCIDGDNKIIILANNMEDSSGFRTDFFGHPLAETVENIKSVSQSRSDRARSISMGSFSMSKETQDAIKSVLEKMFTIPE
jgi:hypothetical protein